MRDKAQRPQQTLYTADFLTVGNGHNVIGYNVRRTDCHPVKMLLEISHGDIAQSV